MKTNDIKKLTKKLESDLHAACTKMIHEIIEETRKTVLASINGSLK